MYVDDMSLQEARDTLRELEAITPGGYGPEGYHGPAGIEQHGWDLEDIRARIAELEA